MLLEISTNNNKLSTVYTFSYSEYLILRSLMFLFIIMITKITFIIHSLRRNSAENRLHFDVCLGVAFLKTRSSK